MIRRMLHSRRVRAGVAGLFLGTVCLSGCAHESKDMFSSLWPFGKKSESTETTTEPASTHAAHIAQAKAAKATEDEKLSVRQRLGKSFAKLVGRERDEFPQDPFIADYGNSSANQHAAFAAAQRRQNARMAAATRSSADSATRVAHTKKATVGGPNVFVSGFDKQIDRQDRVDQLRQKLVQDSAPTITQSAGWQEPTGERRPIITPRNGAAAGNNAGNTASGRNPFEDPKLAQNNLIEELPAPSQSQSRSASNADIVNQRIADLAALENGSKRNSRVREIPNSPQSAPKTNSTGFADTIRTDNAFAHGQGIIPTQSPAPASPVSHPSSNETSPPVAVETKKDSVYGKIRESDDVPSRKFLGPRDFDAVQTNTPINLHPQLDPDRRDLTEQFAATPPSHPIIQQTSLEVPEVTTNTSARVDRVAPPMPVATTGEEGTLPETTVAEPSVPETAQAEISGPSLSNPNSQSGPLIISPSAEDASLEVDAGQSDVEPSPIPQSPIESVEWVEDEFVVDNDNVQESSSWPTIAFLSLALAAIVGLLVRRQGGSPIAIQQPSQDLHVAANEDETRKAA